MKRFFPLLFLVLGGLYLASSLRPARNASEFDLVGFGELPVLVNGRIKPLDTVARTSLLMIQGRQRVVAPDGTRLTPREWLVEAMFQPERADTYRTIDIDHPELQTLLGFTEDDLLITYEGGKKVMALLGFLPSRHRRFSYEQIEPKLAEIDKQAQSAFQLEAPQRTPFQRAVIKLRENLVVYNRLKHSVVPPDRPAFLNDLTRFQNRLAASVAAVRAKQAGEPHDEALAKEVIDLAQRFDFMERMGNLLPIPPPTNSEDPTAWQSVGRTLLQTFETGMVNPYVLVYAGLGHTWRAGQAEQFNTIVKLYHEQLSTRYPEAMKKSDLETRFNQSEPFYRSLNLYVLAFLLALVSWLKWPEPLQRAAYYLVALAFVATTAGILTRMWLEDRPPVTNLYSSALFVGWGCVGLCLVLERIYRNGIGSVAAGLTGLCTLLIAHHLSLSGDTLEMMRAVLDSNFWLATHVIVVTLGYSATFLAGFLGLIYVFRGVLTQSLDSATANALGRMVYGIVCFATLFSLVGTILGGIWADQSWGRFWGWDPKENGALIIVLWNAVILHCRWGGLVRTRGLMALAIGGNIVTSWSWFGTNMLGVGLHSYGFMDAAFVWLVGFILSQLAAIGLALIPLEKWRSAAHLLRPRRAAPSASA